MYELFFNSFRAARFGCLSLSDMTKCQLLGNGTTFVIPIAVVPAASGNHEEDN